MDKPLTSRQKQALDFIVRCIREDFCMPHLREIGKEMGIKSTKGVTDHLDALVRKGWLIPVKLKTPNYRLTDKTRQVYNLYFVSDPTEPPEYIEGEDRYVHVCAHCFRAGCWQGVFCCDQYRKAGMIEKTVKDLESLGLESPHYWQERYGGS